MRDANIAACNFVKSKVNLPNLTFVQDDAWNITKYGKFDAVFCCGLLYHLDRPNEFLRLLSSVTRKAMILQTHFATGGHSPNAALQVFRKAQQFLAKITGSPPTRDIQNHLSPLCENEGLIGRWYIEFPSDSSFAERSISRWASWNNRRSFWIQREYLLQAIRDAGFGLILEQFDSLAPNIADSMQTGYYRAEQRGTFLGIKT